MRALFSIRAFVAPDSTDTFTDVSTSAVPAKPAISRLDTTEWVAEPSTVRPL